MKMSASSRNDENMMFWWYASVQSQTVYARKANRFWQNVVSDFSANSAQLSQSGTFVFFYSYFYWMCENWSWFRLFTITHVFNFFTPVIGFYWIRNISLFSVIVTKSSLHQKPDESRTKASFNLLFFTKCKKSGGLFC